VAAVADDDQVGSMLLRDLDDLLRGMPARTSVCSATPWESA